MKGFIRFTAMLCICALLSGCNFWMDGSYYSETPHTQDNSNISKTAVSVSSYDELYASLKQMVESGTTEGVFSVTDMQERLDAYMKQAILSVKANDPIAAYALEDIHYEIGARGEKQAVAVELTYRHGRSEILRIKQADSMELAIGLITSALRSCESGIVLQIADYQDQDLAQATQDYFNEHPDTCMEMPQISVSVYPEHGQSRVVEIGFTYQTSRESLRNMQETVAPVFSSAKLYVRDDADAWEKCSQLYSFLMNRYTYEFETSITPSYSLLRYGVGDCKAFAMVYAAMCRQVGLSCQMISGTRSGEPWYWNVLTVEGVNYHIDLLDCYAKGSFSAKTDAQMRGYVWDYLALERSGADEG